MEPATYLFIVGTTTMLLVVGFMVFDGIRRWWLRVRPYTTFFTAESPSGEEMTMATFVTNEACIQIYIQFSSVIILVISNCRSMTIHLHACKLVEAGKESDHQRLIGIYVSVTRHGEAFIVVSTSNLVEGKASRLS